MKINIGAGFNKVDGIISIDYDENSNPDFCLDLEKDRLPFEDNTVEFVLAHHILEHLGDGFFHCLQELYRVCKHGAIIDIVVPHPRHEAFLSDPTHKRPITPMTLQLFSKKFNEYCKNRNVASLLGMKFNVDFDIVHWSNVIEDRYKAILMDKPIEHIEEYISERNNVVREIKIKLMVIKEYYGEN
jgi:SAM-dependent methyltransferase